MVQLLGKEEIKNEKEKQEHKLYNERPYEKKPYPQKKQFKPRPAPKSAVDGFVGRDIIIKMRDGKMEVGRLESIFQYEFVIIGGDGLPIIIMKHAVDQIKLKVS